MKEKAVVNRRVHIEFLSPYVVRFTTQLFQRTFRFQENEEGFIINLMNLKKMDCPVSNLPEMYVELSWDDADPLDDDGNSLGRMPPSLVLFIRANLNAKGPALVGVISHPQAETFSISVPIT